VDICSQAIDHVAIPEYPQKGDNGLVVAFRIDIQDLAMKYGEITVAIYRDRIWLEREFLPPS
jgi:hypothetical protein